MSFPYPAKPWQDGQQVNVAMADGTYVIGQYDASKNLWSFRRFRDDQVNREQIFTFDVLTTTSQPAPRDLSPFDTSDPTNLQTQQEVNWFLWNYIRDLELEGAQIAFSTEATMLQAPANIDETFERDPDDLDQYGLALFYINASDHDGATRIVVPKVDTEGFNWTPILRAYGVDDIILTVQIDNLGTPDDTSDDLNYRSEWRIINDPVENPNSFSFEVKHIKDNPDHLPSFGENVYVRLLASQGYVLKTGDTMTGNLVMENADIEIDNGNIEFEAKGDQAYVQDADNRFAKLVSRAPKDIVNGTDTTSAFGIRVELDDGNTFKNQFKVGNRNGDAVTVSGGTGPAVTFGTNFPGNQNEWDDPKYNGSVKIKGIPTPAFDNPEPTIAVNKEYVDKYDDELRQDILELEEEIDAFAPSTQRGEWEFDMSKGNPDPGKYYLLKELFDGGTDFTDQYNEAVAAVFHNTDSNGVDNTWSGVTVDELIQIFDKPDPDFVLGTITAVDTTTVPDGVLIRFNRERGEGSPDNNPDIKLSRVNIFEAPSGGAASDFVLKTGDDMSGPLTLNINKDTTDYNYTAGDAKIRFQNTSSAGGRFGVDLYQAGHSTTLVSSGPFRSKNRIYSSGDYRGWNPNDGSESSPRIQLSSNGNGYLSYNSSSRINWNNSGGLLSTGDATADKRLGWGSSGVYLYSSTYSFGTFRISYDSNSRVYARTSKGGSSEGAGSVGQVLTSNSTNGPVYWSTPTASAKIPISCSSSGRSVGDMWYCNTDGVLYLRIS